VIQSKLLYALNFFGWFYSKLRSKLQSLAVTLANWMNIERDIPEVADLD